MAKQGNNNDWTAQLEQLEAMDSELNENTMTADIDRALRKTSRVTITRNLSATGSRQEATVPGDIGNEAEDDDDMLYRQRPISRVSSAPLTGRRTQTPPEEVVRSPLSARGGMAPSSRRIDPVMEMMDDGGADGGAPDTALRYQKARLKMLAKQLEDSVSLRQQLTEAVNDLQKQLHSEREENKKSRKRIQLLESDAKRNSGRRTAEAVGVDTVDSLSQEVANLRKDVQTAERIAKQSETIAKAKETHLKRALETIARLKTQVSEFQGQTQDSNQGERGKLDAVEARVKLLERQRADLIAAFKKQMKLIDVLKRQKVHLESSRLLHFTEDEFVRTLDWGV